MGEKIKDLGTISIGKAMLKIELNKGTKARGKYDIHIQNNKIRLNLDEYEFAKLANGIIFASEKIKKNKGIVI